MKRVAVLWLLGAAIVVIVLWLVFVAARLTAVEPPEQLAASEAVKDRVRSVVPNPTSAKFSNVESFKPSKTGCGMVIVRSDSGLYSEKFFIAYGTGGVRFSGESSPSEGAGSCSGATTGRRCGLRRRARTSWGASSCWSVMAGCGTLAIPSGAR